MCQCQAALRVFLKGYGPGIKVYLKNLISCFPIPSDEVWCPIMVNSSDIYAASMYQTSYILFVWDFVTAFTCNRVVFNDPLTP